MRTIVITTLTTLIGVIMATGCGTGGGTADSLQPYRKNTAVKPLPAGKACLYGTPWRNNVRTASAFDARDGLGIYYKHVPVPGLWSEEQNTHVLKELAAAGCKRIRYAACHAMYINAEWTAPSDHEQKEMDYILRGCHEAGIRPTVTFVHLPAMGTGDEMHQWWDRSWNKGSMPLGKGVAGDPEYDAYFETCYKALEDIARAARAAGFTKPNSYDLEMGQNLWWGFPAMTPFPGLTLDMLKPGGQVYEFNKALMERLRKAGYNEPMLWWSQCHHLTDFMSDADLPAVSDGRAISIYGEYLGRTDDGWLGHEADEPRKMPTDAWPTRPPYQWIHQTAPAMVIARPESYLADYTRHDNLLPVMAASRKPLAMVSLGVVPSDLPGAMVDSEVVNADGTTTKTRVKAAGVDGWEIKSRAMTRSFAFWLNQGSTSVLVHSAYDNGTDEMFFSLIPVLPEPASFSWKQSQPLRAMHAFASAFDGAVPLKKITPLSFRYSLLIDRMLIPAVPTMGPLLASDAMVILPFQVTPTRYAVAVYVMTPNMFERLSPREMTLEISAAIPGDVRTLVPTTQAEGKATVLSRDAKTTTVQFDVSDDVILLIFDVQP